MNDISDQVVTDGIRQYEKFKAAATEALERCRAAEANASFFKGQCENLSAQKASDDARHRADLLRIAELEAFIGHITELYNGAAQKLKLGGFRRPTSTAEPALDQMEREFAETVRRQVVRTERQVIRTEPLPPLVASKD